MVAATGSEAAVDGSMPEVSTGAPSNWLLCTRHVVCQRQRPITAGTLPPTLDGLGEQLEPALKMLRGERHLSMHQRMGTKRVALIAGHAQQRTAPERCQLGQVLGPVNLGHVVEHGTQQVVLGHVLIEATHHFGDLLRGIQVAFSIELCCAAHGSRVYPANTGNNHPSSLVGRPAPKRGEPPSRMA